MHKILRLKSGRERSVVNRHPWIFSGAVQNLPAAENGEIVAVHSIKNEVLGYGFYSTESQIVCRMFEFDATNNDFTGYDYWNTKIKQAYTLRKAMLDFSTTNAYRLLHAEGDFLPGLIVDVYADTAVLQILIKGITFIKDHVIKSLKELGIKYIYFKNPTNAQNREKTELESNWLTTEANEKLMVKENGLNFLIDVVHGQKTGFFLDQRDNRMLIKSLSKGKKVLNAFSYTGGFSIYALAGGAKEVSSLDISKDAIAVGEENIKLNMPSGANHKGIAEDCFNYIRNTTEIYDLIVLDPPAFAKNSKAIQQAAKGYKELNLQAIRKIAPGGIIATFSCSQHIERDLFRKIVFGAAADAGRNVRILYQLSQSADHPVNIYHPEGEYLKGLVLHVE